VSTVKQGLTQVGNRVAVWMYQALGGRLSSGSKDVHLMIITTPGRRTGMPRSTCVRHLNTAEGSVVWGSGSGSPHDPDWFRNLRKAKVADVQVRSKRIQVRPRELLGGERGAMWNIVVLTQAPEIAKYAAKSRPDDSSGRSRANRR